MLNQMKSNMINLDFKMVTKIQQHQMKLIQETR